MKTKRLSGILKEKHPTCWKKLTNHYVQYKRNINYMLCSACYSPKIMNTKQTIHYIQKTESSMARFGDGELGMVVDESDIGFQHYSEELAKELKRVLTNKQEKLLICLPHYFVNCKGCKKKVKEYWKEWTITYLKKLEPFLKEKVLYGDTQITRPYMDYERSDETFKTYKLLKNIWKGQDLLIVEGEKTRLGVGNDLFSDAKTIKRILAPAENAFPCRQQILEEVVKLHKEELVLLALGPTATILAFDLTKKGIRALDVGHVDLEYEWFLRNASDKTAIRGKYVNEVVGGAKVSQFEDIDYNKQVIAKISC